MSLEEILSQSSLGLSEDFQVEKIRREIEKYLESRNPQNLDFSEILKVICDLYRSHLQDQKLISNFAKSHMFSSFGNFDNSSYENMGTEILGQLGITNA